MVTRDLRIKDFDGRLLTEAEAAAIREFPGRKDARRLWFEAAARERLKAVKPTEPPVE